MLDFCEELPGVWSWDEDIPYPDLIKYLESAENNKSKNLKLAYIASHFYKYSDAYGLDDEGKQRVRKLYESKHQLDNQRDLDMIQKHYGVFINDGHYVEEAILSVYGPKYKLQYYNNTHNGLGRPLTQEELREPDFIDNEGRHFEVKMCWEASASKFESNANLKYEIDPKNFNEKEFLAAFNELPQTKALHKAPWCFCLVKKRATFGNLVGVTIDKRCGVKAKLIGPLEVKFMRIDTKYV